MRSEKGRKNVRKKKDKQKEKEWRREAIDGINKADYSALDASRRRLKEGVTDLRTDGWTDGPTLL